LQLVVPETEPVEQAELLGEIEADEFVLPPGIEPPPGLHRVGDPRGGEQPPGTAAGAGQQLVEPFGQTPRGHDRRRIDSYPALALEPHLGPGMGIGLADVEVAAVAIPGAAQVAGHDARGHATGAHQCDKGRGIVAAKAFVRAEQQVVDRIEIEQRRLERVTEAATTQVIEHGVDVGGLAARALAQRVREFDAAWIALRRQLQIQSPCGRGQRVETAVLRIRLQPVADSAAHWRRRDQLVIESRERVRQRVRQALRQFERDQNIVLVRLQRDFVAKGRALKLQARRAAHLCMPAAPGVAVENMQYRPAPITLGGRRRCAVESHAQRRIAGFRQLRDAAGTHLVAEAGERLIRLWQRPEGAGQSRNK